VPGRKKLKTLPDTGLRKAFVKIPLRPVTYTADAVCQSTCAFSMCQHFQDSNSVPFAQVNSSCWSGRANSKGQQ